MLLPKQTKVPVNRLVYPVSTSRSAGGFQLKAVPIQFTPGSSKRQDKFLVTKENRNPATAFNNHLTHTIVKQVKQFQNNFSDKVIQRAVGFEFETGWLVDNYTDVKIWEKSGRQGKMPPLRPFAKKDLIHSGNEFRVEADEAGGGKSELEFIIHPPIPTTSMAIESLAERMAPVYLFGAKLLSKASSEMFKLNMVTGKPADEKFVIHPADTSLSARPQVTAGISLENIPKLQFPQKGVSLPLQLDQTHVSAGTASIDVDGAAKFLPKEFEVMPPQLKGLLMPIGMYLYNGQRAVSYPKQIADNFLLARTDCAGLFKLLPEDLKTYFRKNPEDFVKIAMAAGCVDDPEAPVIGRVWKNENDPSEGVEPIGPSRRKWLYFITQGYDLLSGSHYKEFLNDDMLLGAEHKKMAKELESLGELGKKTEPTKGEEKEGGIFELRSAALKKFGEGHVPLFQWMPFVEQVLTYFKNLGDS